MIPTTDRPALRLGEFITLVALLMALVALAIDAVLPALPAIGRDFGIQRANDLQFVIMAFLLGLGLGQLSFGPLSDAIGRKPAVYAGLILFMGGCLISIFAVSFPTMIAGRILQGIGIAAPHTVTIALVRDQFAGRRMARLMSFAMAIFILVPTVAPALGQGIQWLGGWRALFVSFLAIAAVAFAWFGVRQPETLPAARRSPLSLSTMGRAVREVVANRAALGFTLAAGCIQAPFAAYLSSAQQIFQEAYRTGTLF
ncbi:MAG: multidrug effflux MFS transporter, partial [Boseongicola sp. SB0676_bin_33]|nr:multidrug effflux MFS transporter [Boseongicola sp. SB0676_bin_33]